MQIEVSIRNKTATLLDDVEIVCGNSDYTILFSFDDEWDEFDAKIAHFSFLQNGVRKFTDMPIEGSVCEVPVLSNTKSVEVGVYAGQLRTTTPCLIKCKRSALCDTAEEMAKPFENLYDTLMEEINRVDVKTIQHINSGTKLNIWDLPSGIYKFANEANTTTTLKFSNRNSYPCQQGTILMVTGKYCTDILPNSNTGTFKKSFIIARCVGPNAFDVQTGVTTVNFVKNEDDTVSIEATAVFGNIEHTGLKSNSITDDTPSHYYPTVQAVQEYAVAKDDVESTIAFDLDDNKIYNVKAINDMLYVFAERMTALEDVLLDHTVRFMVGDKPYETVSVKSGSSVNSPVADPTSDAGVFVGWQYNGSTVTFPHPVEDNIRLDASFVASQVDRLYEYYNVDKTVYPYLLMYVSNNGYMRIHFSEVCGTNTFGGKTRKLLFSREVQVDKTTYPDFADAEKVVTFFIKNVPITLTESTGTVTWNSGHTLWTNAEQFVGNSSMAGLYHII